ncbi:MAG: putative bifunctional diguanylate cyclase/phosphodiesterase, partial [Myxococcota bacterium]
GGAAESDQRVSRLGGDEFTILLVEIRVLDEATLVAKRILRALERPLAIEGRDVYVTASIGIALSEDGVDSVDGLLRNADLAMYHAKETGRNSFQVFHESMRFGVERRTVISTDLRTALERREFVLHYQPLIDAATRRVSAFEALLRWNHAERGMLRPASFIQVAEATGQIIALGDWALREACRTCGEWQRAGHPEVGVAVNVSGHQLRRDSFRTSVAEALARAGLDARSLEIEVTESAVAIDEAEIARVLREVKDLGVRVALDDFGTGCSSLSNIRSFPIDTLKIDRSFVAEIPSTREARAIASAIIGMAGELGLAVVAEGVETEAQERFLCERGCDQLQGFRFARPLPSADAVALLGSLAGDPGEVAGT